MTPTTAEQRDAFMEASRELADELELQTGGIRRTGPRTWETWSRTRHGLLNHRINVALDGAVLCTCEAGLNNLDCWAVNEVKQELGMTTETALVPVKVNPPARLIPSRQDRMDIKETAAMVMAGAISLPDGIKTPDQAAALMLYGWELGIPPMTALQKLYMVNGRVAPSAEVMAGIVMRDEPDIRITVETLTEEECTLIIQRPSRHVHAGYSVTWDEIERAGLNRGMNLQYRRDRLRYHCMKRLLRTYCPDLINNLGAPIVASLQEDADEEAIEGEYRVNTATGEILHSQPVIARDTPREPSQPRPQRQSSSSSRQQQSRAGSDWQTAFWKATRELGYSTDAVLAESQKRFANREPQQLNDGERAQLLTALREAKGVKDEAAKAIPEHEHELQYTEGGEPVCGLCDVPLDEETQQPKEAVAGGQTSLLPD